MSKKKSLIFIVPILILVVMIMRGNDSKESIIVKPLPFPYKFAFTITDDPDEGWLEQKKTVYDFLDSLNMKISIGVWMYANTQGTGKEAYYNQGVALDNKQFLDYIIEEKNKGHKLFFHTVTGGNDKREITLKGFEDYKRIFGEYPNHWINHTTNYENIYWGYKRITIPVLRYAYKLYSSGEFYGDDENSEYYWGDICKKHIKYVRGFATNDLNTYSVHANMPYHESKKGMVKYWYGCSDGYNKDKFNELTSKENVDRLVKEEGIAIIYTHLASGFVSKEGVFDQTTKERLAYVAQQENGWFVPAETILDRLLEIKNIQITETDSKFIVANLNDVAVENLQLKIDSSYDMLFNGKKISEMLDEDNNMHIDKIAPHSVVTFEKTGIEVDELSFLKEFSLVLEWLISR